MHNVEAVEVFDGVGQVVEHAAGVSLRVPVGRGDGIEQISTLRTNHNRRAGCQYEERFSLTGVCLVFSHSAPDRFTSKFSPFLLRRDFSSKVDLVAKVFVCSAAGGVNCVLIPHRLKHLLLSVFNISLSF